MKKRVWIFASVIVVVIAGASYFYFSRPQLEIAKSQEVQNVVVEPGGKKLSQQDAESILKKIREAKKTFSSSNTDQPSVNKYYTLKILDTKDSEDTLYVFEENGKVYIERPYDGIYRSNSELMTRIEQIVDN
ncbi:TPA: DUF5301 domain-containing protein [Enterococcus faecium]|jgi:uncharacterized protein YpmB|uniref:DUF5301 domain-containing protein n=5 Tax=Enterococcus TaxID=1350 RepID=A0ABD5FDB9_ENTAV|nr:MULTISPECIES: DUF5301 domain-containing protein [Enterococcus]HJB24820.1 DUF5301 domain-containing protein [Candidatus Jeotgalibaca pullicola]EGO7726302.1 DUF5301 domain-containing protein [Enterococcus faecalis]KAF1298276.1 hypothetical protein BAU18_13385 [Enterococcus diestrammenae]KAF1304337.1 hypothetical protein BAU16_02050 [Enterococcus sp. JM9B]MBO6333217.1 hypothetical protein [Enterococcus faecium]